MPRPGQAKYRRQRELAQAQAAAEAEASASTSTATLYGTNEHRATYTFQHDPYDEQGDYCQYDETAGSSYGYHNGGREGDGKHDGLELDDDDGMEEDNGNGGSGSGKRQPRAQCLPIGELPLDFDGIPTDGSQYLAMVIKANEDLPFVKAVDNPYKRACSPSKQTPVSTSTGGGAGPSRHPALPKESWGELFPTHFRGYKKNVLSRLPPTSLLPYPSHYPPLPNASHRSEWYAFINGYITGQGKGKGKGKEKENAKANGQLKLSSKSQEVKGALRKTSKGNERRIGEEREPLVSVIQRLNSTQAIVILSHFAYWLTELVNQLPSPIPDSPDFEPTLLPTQPEDPSDTTSTTSNGGVRSVKPPPKRRDVISSNYFNWIFALLLILDDHLSSDQISILRDLARSAMKVAGYRWVTAVVARDVGDGWVLGGNWKAARDSDHRGTREVAIPPGTQTGTENGLIGPQIPAAPVHGDAGQEISAAAGAAQVNEDVEKRERQESVDDTLAKCWLIVHSVATGWGQRDLLEELETLFT
ncbi:hypothetical protein I317_01118 [Kwoniella heveanensis CBS 569]|nr:hypothetical protein I317_01118 [Kwoniella heveanensis CBS 569]